MSSNKVIQDEPKGIVCRACGCRHFFVVYVRPVRGGRIMRRRECRNCGRRYTSFEHLV